MKLQFWCSWECGVTFLLPLVLEQLWVVASVKVFSMSQIVLSEIISKIIIALSLKVFWHKEREAQSFYSGFFISPPHLVQHLPKASASKRKSTLLVRCLVSTLLTFFKFPKSSARLQCVMSFTLASPVSHLGLLWHLWVTCLLRPHAYTCVNTCTNVAPK